jgi:hypothetical protein
MTSNALTVTPNYALDEWDEAATELSPIRGLNMKFDGGAYFSGREKTPLDTVDRQFVVMARAEGWQFLQKDRPAQYVMRDRGADKPERPHVDETEWPTNLSGKPEHPWRYTFYIYLLDPATGETSTFSTNTAGGAIAVRELTDQIRNMRQMKPRAVPVVQLESRQFKTGFGLKQRPHFKIEGWKQHSFHHEAIHVAEPEPELIGEVSDYEEAHYE